MVFLFGIMGVVCRWEIKGGVIDLVMMIWVIMNGKNLVIIGLWFGGEKEGKKDGWRVGYVEEIIIIMGF